MTNTLTNEFYIGARSSEMTPEQDKHYLGTGVKIKEQLKKYGKQNFRKDILVKDICSFDDKIRIEKIFLNEFVLKDPLCLNMRTGGGGTWKRNKPSEETKRKMTESHKMRWERNRQYYVKSRITQCDEYDND